MYASLKRGTLLSARYRILAQIGAGGFGTVYKARDRSKHGKLVAIKEINMTTLSAQEKIEVTDSFNREITLLSNHREITLLSNLKHKNLPRIYDHFTDPEHWYIVMDYIEGQTLEDLLARSSKGRLSLEQTIRISHALCDVLSYLHNQNPAIIFRDVKPGNIMLTFWDTSISSTSVLPAAIVKARHAILARSAPPVIPPLNNMVVCKPRPRPISMVWALPSKPCSLEKNLWRSACKAFLQRSTFPGNCKH